jgi:hypothetical protein
MEERARLESIAKEWFSNPESMPQFQRVGGVQRVMRLWRYPSLRGPWRALVLYHRAAFRYRGVVELLPADELTWERKADLAAARARDPDSTARPDPTITIHRWGVPSELVERRFAELQALVFPPFSSSGYGTDGTHFGVEAKLGFGSTTIHWWANAPEGFAPLARWYDETWDEARKTQPETPRAGEIA